MQSSSNQTTAACFAIRLAFAREATGRRRDRACFVARCRPIVRMVCVDTSGSLKGAIGTFEVPAFPVHGSEQLHSLPGEGSLHVFNAEAVQLLRFVPGMSHALFRGDAVPALRIVPRNEQSGLI